MTAGAAVLVPSGSGAASGASSPSAGFGTMDMLWEAPAPSRDARGEAIPAELLDRYGGPLRIELRPDRPTVVANFVSTLDGIVALGNGPLAGGGLISGAFEPDRFVMGLLRATADVVVVGAGTLRGSNRQRWIAEHVHPASARAFADWRRAMGLAPFPTTVVVTGSGAIPIEHPGLTDPRIPVVIATTPKGATALRNSRLGANVAVESIGTGGTLTGTDLAALSAGLGAGLVLTEGGPHLMGPLLTDDLVDELFLTIAPQLVGRGDGDRLGLVEGLALAPGSGRWAELRSVRRVGAHLFLRYRRAADGPSGHLTNPAQEH
jgi:riboflavin biosynthesis pyrimidine reductase